MTIGLRCANPLRPTRRSFLSSAAFASSSFRIPAVAQPPPPSKADQWLEPGASFRMDFWCLPRVQFWSFDSQDPILKLFGFDISVQIITTGPDENTYSLHAGSLLQSEVEGGLVVCASQLITAGQQVLVPGSCEIHVLQRGNRIGITTTATVEEGTVRAIKLVLRHLPPGRVGFTGWESVPNLAPVPVKSLALAYPTYQGGEMGYQHHHRLGGAVG